MIKNNPSVLIRSFVFKKKIVTLLWPTMQCHLSFFLYRIHWIICGLHWLPVDFQKAYQCKISVRCCHNPSYCMTWNMDILLTYLVDMQLCAFWYITGSWTNQINANTSISEIQNITKYGIIHDHSPVSRTINVAG